VPDWLLLVLLATAWTPLLVLLHELGHALTAMALTDGGVSVELRKAGLMGGAATYDGELRYRRAEAWIAAAGPAVSLAVAAVLWFAWVKSGADSVVTLLGAGALGATFQFFTSALPLRYGAGLGGPADSDGRVIWRVLTGAPPGGIDRELRGLGEPERIAHPVALVLIVLVAALAFVLEPMLAVGLAFLFGVAFLLQLSEARR
jgi:hypothetical protein